MAAQPRPFNNSNNASYLPNGAPTGVPGPGATPLLPNQGRVVQAGSSRILCVADVRGNLTSLNDLAKNARADYIIHTGDFGFYDDRSLDRIAEKTLKHVVQYSPLVAEETKRQVANAQANRSIKDSIPRNQLPLSQLPYFLNNHFKFDVPVYTVWGACEDVQVLEKLRSGEYKVDKLHILDEAHSRLLEVGGVKLRLLGLGGAVVMHKLFDNGEGRTTIAGGQGTMWTTLLQMGELVDTANRTYDPGETRVLVTHASPAREGLLNQLSVTLKVDFSLSAGLHFRYGSSYNEFSVNPTLDHYRGKLAASKASFQDVWETVKSEVEPAVADNEAQQKLLQNALEIVNRMPSVANGSNPFGGHVGPSTGQIDEMAFKNMWNFNLADAAYGYLILEIEGGRIGTEMKAQGFNFAHRSMKNPVLQPDAIKGSAASPGVGSAAAPTPGLGATTPGQAPPTGPTATPPSQPASQQAKVTPQTGVQQTQAIPPSVVSQVQQSQPAITKLPTATAPVPATSPAAPSPSQAAKSIATDQSTSTAATSGSGVSDITAPADVKPNGVASPTPTGDLAAMKDTPPPADKKPSTGIYVQHVSSEEEVRNLFSEEDRAKIQRIDKIGRFNAWAAHFSTPEEMQAVLKAAPQDLKKAPVGKPSIKVFQERGPSDRRYDGAASGWGTGSRAAGQQAAGYKSGGASDSEGGRGGRGGFRGGRARGGGTERGGRGRGDRGRGKAGQGEGAPSSSPAPTTPSASAS